MSMNMSIFLLSGFLFPSFFTIFFACGDGTCQIRQNCSLNTDCSTAEPYSMYCFHCIPSEPSTCRRFQANMPTTLIPDQPFNRYSWIVTHNSFCNKNAPTLPGVTRSIPHNQEDSVASQLTNGVRGLVLEMYEFNNDIWLCRSLEGKCSPNDAYGPALDTLRDVATFLKSTPYAIITIFIKDHVSSKDGLTNLFALAGLDQYRFPLSKMPGRDDDWPKVNEMVEQNHRLLIFTSDPSKEKDGFAYQWRYVLENKYGDYGMNNVSCQNRDESEPLTAQSPSLFLMNFWLSMPDYWYSCTDNSAPLAKMAELCREVNKYPNYIAVDFYMRSMGGGVFNLVDHINGKTLCGCSSIYACQLGKPGQCLDSQVYGDPPNVVYPPFVVPPSGTTIQFPPFLMFTFFYLLFMV